MSNVIWALLINKKGNISDRAIYHCFENGISMCGKHKQTEYPIDIESGEILSNPQFACKVCRKKWREEFNL